MFPHGILYLMSSIGFVISCEDTDVYIYEAPSSFTDIPVHAKIVNQENGFNYSEQLSVVGCGAVFTSPEIRIQSPQFPNSYPRDTLCLYVINAVSPNVCLIEVNFLNFDLGSCGNGDSLVVAGQSLCGFLNGIQTFRFSPPGSLIQFSNKTKINISFAENDRNINTTNNYFSIHSVNSQLTDSQNKNLTKLEKAAGERLSMIKPNNGDINALINSHSQSTMNADVVLDTNSLHNHSKMNLNGQLIFDGNNTKDTIQCELLSEENRIRNNCSSLVITTTTREKRNAFSPEVPAMYYYPSPNSGSDRLWFLGESSCRIWGFAQWLLQAKQYFWNSVPDLFCPVASQPRCQIFNQVLGWIQSSGYPQAYPSNSNTCYRFQRLQGYCQIQLTIADFSLEYSNNCAKDYFLIGKRRYCGEQLASTYPVLDISTTSQVDLTFVSDGYYSGRGFRIHYQYLPCGRYARAISVSSSNCDKVIRDRNFILTQNEADGEDFCTYNILQNSTSHLCNLQLAFSKFDLICGQEFLQIGREQYCGNLSGQSVDVQFLNSEIPVRLIYHKLANIGQSSQCVIQLSDIQGFVSYPGFELASTESGVCSYVIKPQEGMCSVKLKFSNFFIPSQQGKCTRFLDVGGTKFCSDELKDKDIEMNFNGLELEIPISIEGKTKISAWNFTYTQLPCGETRL
ncbi:hypothetical protein C0J52_05768 [Blattella germanica]|nr:hypothetical protein C0J52_05768 [Blattella germanica]